MYPMKFTKPRRPNSDVSGSLIGAYWELQIHTVYPEFVSCRSMVAVRIQLKCVNRAGQELICLCTGGYKASN